MNKIIFFLILIVSLFLIQNCKSIKGDHVQIFDEAKQMQKILNKTTGINNKDLQNIINDVGEGSIFRWKISDKDNLIIESTKSYSDYKNPSSCMKFIYAINNDYDLILIN